MVGLAPVARADEPAPASGGDASPTVNEQARKHFSAGVALLQDPDGEKVEEAYREFKTAYEMSGSPKVLGNMGLCAMRLERDGEAIDAYSRYLREVKDIDPEERAQIVRDLETLTVGVARLTIEVNKPGVRLVDVRYPVRGERITNVYGPVDGKIEIGVRPGHHVLTARLPGNEDATWELEAYAGGRDKYSFTLREPPPRVAPLAASTTSSRSSSNIGPWLVMGTGAAMLIAGSVTGIVALGKTNDLADRCPSNTCPKSFDLDGARSDAKTFVRITDVLLIGGGIVTAGGIGWLLFSNSSESSAPAPTPTAKKLPSIGCSGTGCSATWETTF
ncbi:hypothetical protein AKJ09_03857 [Labilithrix luteola]|uniref:PEGA domain-containing protein n=1 Tax=Labilithrix luteola TaxID=1391654 RepID=A0A0K1PUH6_9BACT|nr:hypothetical protein AKJ09_03857 [Labilithrix luteola]